MSLNWNLTKIKGHEDLCYYELDEKGEDGKPLVHLSAVTEALIWYTIPARLGEITEKNWQEFWLRVHVIETVFGCSVRDADGSDHHITPEEVRAHTGLSCNVSDETQHKFDVAMGRSLRQDAKDWRRRWERKEEKVGLPREHDAVA